MKPIRDIGEDQVLETPMAEGGVLNDEGASQLKKKDNNGIKKARSHSRITKKTKISSIIGEVPSTSNFIREQEKCVQCGRFPALRC